MPAQQNQLYKDVAFLTGVEPSRNFANLEVLESVCNYIKSEIEAVSGMPIEQKWEARGNEYKNIIVSYNPDKKRRLIVGAH